MAYMLSDKGNVRYKNEDYIGFYEGGKFQIYIVADGMGGHNAGEIASELAVKTTIDYIRNLKNIDDMESGIIKAIELSNKEILKMSSQNKTFEGMGTTITACVKLENKMFVANVGDSGCFILKKEGLIKITKDHSYVQELLDKDSITFEEAMNHPHRNLITRALGSKSSVEIDIFKVSLDEVIKVILCTDGISKEVTSEEIFDIVANNTSGNSCRQLIDLSKLKGGKDNISIIIFDGNYRSSN